MYRAAPPSELRFEHLPSEGLGIGTGSPRISWQIPTADAGYSQTAYELEIAVHGSAVTHRFDSAEQVLVPWPARPLESRQSALVRVRVAHGEDWSEWSETASVEAGLLMPSDWSARFISPVGIGALGEPAPIVASTVDIPGEIASARLYATAHGIYDAYLNGMRVGDQLFSPGWTAYRKRLRYQTFDVTHLLKPGENTLSAVLGNGWYRGHLGWAQESAYYGDQLALLAQLEVRTVDGVLHTLATDGTWTSHVSEIDFDDFYDGQVTDLRRRGRARTLHPVEVIDADLNRLVAPEGPPVRAIESLPAKRVWQSPSGKTLVDFGQNLVGWVRLRVSGLADGDVVQVRHAEVLEAGELCTRPLRAAKATDTYFMNGAEEQWLEPSLTFHGFRFAEVTGVPDLRASDLEAVVVGSDLTRTGWFASSHSLLNQFHDNVIWSMRGNFVDVPTDCPQRDERLGWTGDAQVFAPAASFLFDTSGFMNSWLADLAADQHADGTIPHVIPDIHRSTSPAAAAWGDAAVFVPWTQYQRFGDAEILRRQMPSMCAWVDRVATLAGEGLLWSEGFQYGDWLDPTAPPQEPAAAKTDPYLLATAHFERASRLLAAAAEVLGDDALEHKYSSLADGARSAFLDHYVTPAGRLLSDAQTAYAMAIEWDLLTAEQRREAGDRLADLVRGSGFRISTGFVGTPLTTDALTTTGHADLAYRLLLQTGCPSWLYPVTMGATTIWERWDSMLPDGSINPGEMTSFNHYALGAVADWMHRTVAGLSAASAGYRRLRIRPIPSSALTYASARHLTPYGEAAVAWHRGEGAFHLEVRVPVGTSAEIHLPDGSSPIVVGHGSYSYSCADPTMPTTRPATTVRAVMDDSERWQKVVEVAGADGLYPGGEPQVAKQLSQYLGRPACELAPILTFGRKAEVTADLSARLGAALPGVVD